MEGAWIVVENPRVVVSQSRLIIVRHSVVLQTRGGMHQIASSEARKRFRFLNNLSPVVPSEGLFSDSRGNFPYIFEILVKIREIFEPISGIVREIYGVFKAIFGIACKIERVLKEMRGVSLPISRVACKTREIRTMIWGVGMERSARRLV